MISRTLFANKAFRLQVSGRRNFSSSSGGEVGDDKVTNEHWSDEWRSLGLGARRPKDGSRLTNLLFVQVGFGVDQHGDPADGATKAAVRAVRNAIEFNAIPGAITAIPGGRAEMLIQVKLGVSPAPSGSDNTQPMYVDLSHVAKVFPYGRLMPIEVCIGGLLIPTGRVVHELGDKDDMGVCVAACVSIGYDDGSSANSYRTYSTEDGY
eukprot:CAMPEP_0196822850 /NCGR_PEP_ID=MMETSP1362-20130617/85031_1 /TAXON_ID=163516 /ORGANISM="Leptocylindrus danicus, Strain CCMP1856" /LENGTH=207 /DNA_ID=CAMNT_0042202525 /DNA_START=146 /DNA_END=769 /DNA_ORIENTATION=+